MDGLDAMRLIVGLAILCLAGCGQRGTVDDHAGGGETVTIADAKHGTIKAEIGASATMPAGLPAWTPQYPGSTIVVSQVHGAGADQQAFINVTMKTPDSLPQVSAFYSQQVAAAGVKPMHESADASGSTRMIQTSAGLVSINVARDDEGGSIISISRMKE